MQDVVYNSAFDDDYAALDNSPILTSLPSDENQSLMALEQNASCNEPSCLKLSGENTDRCRYESVSSEGMSSDDGNTAFRVEDLEIPTNLQVHTRQSEVQPVKHFYFYQGKESILFTIIYFTDNCIFNFWYLAVFCSAFLLKLWNRVLEKLIELWFLLICSDLFCS